MLIQFSSSCAHSGDRQLRQFCGWRARSSFLPCLDPEKRLKKKVISFGLINDNGIFNRAATAFINSLDPNSNRIDDVFNMCFYEQHNECFKLINSLRNIK